MLYIIENTFHFISSNISFNINFIISLLNIIYQRMQYLLTTFQNNRFSSTFLQKLRNGGSVPTVELASHASSRGDDNVSVLVSHAILASQ